VNDLVAAVLRLGADPRDDEDLRLRKVLLLSAALMIVPAALAWGATYWALVKGRSEPIEPYVLVSLDEATGPASEVANAARLRTG
jgi:hypothetical protein